jgi:hypothetical protein
VDSLEARRLGPFAGSEYKNKNIHDTPVCKQQLNAP